MTNDDHAALIEIKHRLAELHALQSQAEQSADWDQYREVLAEIAAAEAIRTEIIRRTEPEDIPKL